jgi:hypothetical protein
MMLVLPSSRLVSLLLPLYHILYSYCTRHYTHYRSAYYCRCTTSARLYSTSTRTKSSCKRYGV